MYCRSTRVTKAVVNVRRFCHLLEWWKGPTFTNTSSTLQWCTRGQVYVHGVGNIKNGNFCLHPKFLLISRPRNTGLIWKCSTPVFNVSRVQYTTEVGVCYDNQSIKQAINQSINQWVWCHIPCNNHPDRPKTQMVENYNYCQIKPTGGSQYWTNTHQWLSAVLCAKNSIAIRLKLASSKLQG